MLLVEFTYQDYLKYQKYLEKKQQMIKKGKYTVITNENQDKFANIINFVNEMLEEKEFTYEEANQKENEDTMVMEESTPYVFERKRIRRKQKKA